jgi:hypothetical protein
MRTRNCTVLVGVFIVVGFGCGGGDGGGKFMTSIPGDTPLGSLTPDQNGQLCHDEQAFLSRAAVEMDSCRVAAFFSAAFVAGLSSTSTDAELRQICATAYDGCLHPDGGASSGGGGDCNPPPATCTATVSELAACLDDEVSVTHESASAVPACSAFSRAGLTAADGGMPATGGSQPESCRTLTAKCSSAPSSEAAQAFGTEYCALVEPCCASQGLTSQCSGTLLGAALGLDFDPAAAATCLAALHARQAGPDFCGGLATVHPSWNNDSAVIPECLTVFKAPAQPGVGTAEPGAACHEDTDCAPGPTGHSGCVFDIFRTGAANDGSEICTGISGRSSDPCVGTFAGGGYSGNGGGPSNGFFCDRSQGVICDSATQLCVPGPGLGDHCESSLDCDGVVTYCNFNVSVQACAPRLTAGQTCAGSDASECVDGTYCHPTTHQCTPQHGFGAACSPTISFPSECLAGLCKNTGTCPSLLSPLCF